MEEVRLAEMQDKAKELLAVVQLQYHNQNWLTNPKQVNEMMQEKLNFLINDFDAVINKEEKRKMKPTKRNMLKK